MIDSGIQHLNGLPLEVALEALRGCCGSEWWSKCMTAQRPYESIEQLHMVADKTFDRMARDSWLEAFGSHPRIGDLQSLKMKFAGNKQWSSSEQAGVQQAEESVLQELQSKNQGYYQRFGYIFIICATGLTAAEMLSALNERLANHDQDELQIAAREQRKITHLRIDKLMSLYSDGGKIRQ